MPWYRKVGIVLAYLCSFMIIMNIYFEEPIETIFWSIWFFGFVFFLMLDKIHSILVSKEGK